MDIWDISGYASWIIAGLLLIWIVADAISVGRQFDEDFLLSSREGEE